MSIWSAVFVLGSARVPRPGERVLVIVNFSSNSARRNVATLERRSFLRDAAATDAKQRPGFPTDEQDACAPQI
jgi:hypothetical protein